MKRDDFRSRIDPKPPLNEETVRKNLEMENYGRLVGEGDKKIVLIIEFIILFLSNRIVI